MIKNNKNNNKKNTKQRTIYDFGGGGNEAQCIRTRTRINESFLYEVGLHIITVPEK